MAGKDQTNATLAEIAEVIRRNDDFVLCGHVSPDGDCIGSQLALANALEALGKNVCCLLAKDDPVDPTLAFLPGFEDLVAAKRYTGPCGVFIALDVPTRERLVDAADLLDRCRISITVDHHPSEERMTDYAYIEPDSPSASIIVWELVKLLVEEPSAQSALCAYTGLVTDTGGFRHQNTDARAFAAAADLVARGVDPAAVATQVFQNRTRASLLLEQTLISNLELFEEGRVALSWVTQADLERVGAAKTDTDSFVELLRQIDTARVVCFLRETDGAIRASLRSKGAVDVSKLAREFGGGGHAAAAGFSLDLPMEESVELMRAQLSEFAMREEHLK